MKLATIALLIGIFLSLPILGQARTALSALFLAASANVVAAALVIIASYFLASSELSFGIAPTIMFLAALVLPVTAIAFVPAIVRRMLKRIEDAPQSDAVSENYLSELLPRSLFAACGLMTPMTKSCILKIGSTLGLERLLAKKARSAGGH